MACITTERPTISKTSSKRSKVILKGVDEAEKYYKSSMPKCYFEAFSPAELHFRKDRHFMDWSQDELEAMTWHVGQVMQIIKMRAPRLLPHVLTADWVFGKISGTVYPFWNIPFTAGCMIVLPEPNVVRAVLAYKNKDSNELSTFWNLLFNQWVYIFVRQNKLNLDRLYSNFWGLERKKVVIGSDWKEVHITDANTFSEDGTAYIVHIDYYGNRRSFLPLNIVSENGKPRAILLLVEEDCQDGIWRTTKLARDLYQSIHYLRRFNGMERQLYHPENIFANFMADYVVNHTRYIGNNPAAPDVYDAIDKLVGTDQRIDLGVSYDAV